MKKRTTRSRKETKSPRFNSVQEIFSLTGPCESKDPLRSVIELILAEFPELESTVIRMAIAKNRDIAELMTAGLHGERALDGADQLRLEQMLAEYAWASFHIWDRTQRGVFPKGTFEATAGPLLCELLGTARGGAWWRSAKHTGFIPGFVVDVDAVLAKNSGASVVLNKDSMTRRSCLAAKRPE